MQRKDISAVILAGGKSSRLNIDKALLKIDGTFILEVIYKKLNEIFEEVIVISSNKAIKQSLNVIVVEDNYIDSGPLGGIEAAIAVLAKPVFVFSCDQPFVDKCIIHKQIDIFLNSEADIVIPAHKNGIEPLHSIYSEKCLPIIRQNLDNDIFAVRKIFDYLKVSYLNLELNNERIFFNINSYKDLKKYKSFINS